MNPKNAHNDLVKASYEPEEASYGPKRPLMDVIKVSYGLKQVAYGHKQASY